MHDALSNYKGWSQSKFHIGGRVIFLITDSIGVDFPFASNYNIYNISYIEIYSLA